MVTLERCKHDMLEGTCAICLGHQLGDEDGPEIYFGGLTNGPTKASAIPRPGKSDRLRSIPERPAE